jgi:hypothetical protein
MLQNNAELPKIHWMIDIETLDTRPGAVILSIGVCEVRLMPEHGRLFYEEVGVWSQMDRTESVDTKEWWKTQPNCPYQGTQPLYEILTRLTTFFKEHPHDPIIWCKGTDFDVMVLADAFREHNLALPWKYNHVRDFRTVRKIFGHMIQGVPENTQKHNALADAIHQAKELSSMYLELK